MRLRDSDIKGYATALALLLALAALAYAFSPKAPQPTEEQVQASSLFEYFQTNISALSPEKEVLGGKFIVTEINMRDGEGTVFYEDGHNAFIGDFTYSAKRDGTASVETFTLRR
ncbi:MAG: hypothetical protein HZA81_01920 [Candidatus Taylorbacteria bacterium]|nr:hypothetical protein [Candidatus Taylorbacteria bacterium]